MSCARNSGTDSAAGLRHSSLIRSLLVMPTDYGLLCLVFLLWGWPTVFAAAYSVLFVGCLGFLVLALPKWYHDMRQLDQPARHGEHREPSTRGRAPRALIAHPGAELYGSDRVMLETITALVDAGWHVDVTIPERGPLLQAAEQRGASVRLDAVPVLREGGTSTLGVPRARRADAARRPVLDPPAALDPTGRRLRVHADHPVVATAGKAPRSARGLPRS